MAGSEGKQGRFWGVPSRGPRSLIERLDREGGRQEGGSPGQIRVSGLSCWLMVVPLAVRGDSGLGNTLGRITYPFKTLVFFSPKMEKMLCGLQLITKIGKLYNTSKSAQDGERVSYVFSPLHVQGPLRRATPSPSSAPPVCRGWPSPEPAIRSPTEIRPRDAGPRTGCCWNAAFSWHQGIMLLNFLPNGPVSFSFRLFLPLASLFPAPSFKQQRGLYCRRERM